MTAIDARVARQALADLPEGAGHGEKPGPKRVYLPPSHLKAMDLDRVVVTGMRGAGKTFWWGALQKRAVRRLIENSSAVPTLKENTQVRAGFGVAPRPDDYPGTDFLARAMSRHEPQLVWRTVMARHLAPPGHPLRELREWPERIGWASDDPEATDRLFRESEGEYGRKGGDFLILFDAADRCAGDWKDVYPAVRGLLRLASEMRAYRRLHVKLFLRPDLIDESPVTDFSDAPRVLASRIELSWPRRELYGLLWQSLANGERGKLFRKFLGGDWPRVESRSGKSAYRLPRELADEDEQPAKFHEIAGKRMAGYLRRSVPYNWIPNRLGDARGNVSPRSFLAALRAAAADTEAKHREHRYALHHDSIVRGVREAYRTRVREIGEEYPWVDRVLAPISGMSVPLEFGEIADAWRNRGILERLGEEKAEGETRLPPKNLHRGADGVREDLESLGIFQRLLDGRVNMPDVFRAGYGLGRKGGVKPAR